MAAAELTVIIVSWNSKEYLRGCLKSIPGAARRHPCTVVVVDNGSTDGSVEMIHSEFPEAALIRNEENRGFAAANNIALRSVETQYVVLLNPDTVPAPGSFDGMIDFLGSRPDVWAAGPRMRNADGTDQRTGVRFPSIWTILCESFFLDRLFPWTHLFGGQRELYTDPSSAREVDYLQGSCLMVRTEAVRRVGLLDERFFMYFEETDWCLRIKEEGGKVMYVPEGSVVHYGGAADAHYGEKKILYYHASLIRFYGKHHTVPAGMLLRVILIVRSLFRIVAWSVLSLFRPSLASIAGSSVRGYAKSFVLLFRKAQ